MAENRRILVVDHEPRALVDMGRVLRSAGYDVLEAATGKECLLLTRERRPHLILVDEALPDISGIDLVKQIKHDEELSRAYVAVLSREGTAPAIQARALESGADGLIVRTSQTREFLARVDALLRRQTTEERLRTSLQEHRATFDAMSDAIYLVSMDYTITDCNLALARFLARPRGDIVGGRCFELVHGAAKPIPACLGQRVRETRRRESLVVPMEDRWLQVDVDPLLDASGAVIGSVHVLRDITEQRRTADALQQAQQELDARATEHHLTVDKMNKDLQAEVEARLRAQDELKSVQASLEARGREIEELTRARQSAEENLQRLQGELRAIAAQAADLVYVWEVDSGRMHLVHDTQGRFTGAGSGFPATVGELQGMIHPQDRARVVESQARHVAQGTPWSTEYRVVHHDGQVAYWSVSAAPLGSGAAGEWMAVVRDVTALRRAEQEKETLTAQLHQAQKMDALRRLATGVANEFNRLLATIIGQVEMLLARIEPSHPLYGDLQAIARVARQGVALIRRLLAFAGREALQPEALDVNAVLQELRPKLERALGQRVALQLVLAEQLPTVYADASVLQDVALNLAARAVAAMPRGGVLRVHTAGVTLTEAYVRTRPLARVGEYVRLTMACQGAVVPEAELEGLFELQVAPAEAEVGGELGLGVVHGLVQQLGGFMEVTQTAAGETVWEVYLPAYPAQGTEEEAPVAEGAAGVEMAEPAIAAEAAGAGAPELGVTEPPEPPVVAAQEAGPLPAAEGAAQAVPAAGEELAAPVAGGAAEAEPGAGEPLAGPVAEAPAVAGEVTESVPSAPAAELPSWLVQEPVEGDITGPSPAPSEAPSEPTSDITEEEPSAPPPSGLSALRSRLRRLGRRKN